MIDKTNMSSDQTLKVDIDSSKKKGDKTPNLLSQENKGKINDSAKQVVKSTNMLIATISQNRINSDTIGSVKSILAQLKSAQGKIDAMNTKISTSILVKKVTEAPSKEVSS